MPLLTFLPGPSTLTTSNPETTRGLLIRGTNIETDCNLKKKIPAVSYSCLFLLKLHCSLCVDFLKFKMLNLVIQPEKKSREIVKFHLNCFYK